MGMPKGVDWSKINATITTTYRMNCEGTLDGLKVYFEDESEEAEKVYRRGIDYWMGFFDSRMDRERRSAYGLLNFDN